MPLTAEQIEKSRAEFELFYKNKFMELGQDSKYLMPYKNMLWMGWLARQETLCVELPPGEYFQSCDFEMLRNVEVIDAISAVGIAHK